MYRNKTHAEYMREWRNRHKERLKPIEQERSARYKATNPESVMLSTARSRAKRKGLEFDISLEDIVIPEICPILGCPLEKGDPTRNLSPSLDRIDNSRGYIKGNIMVISNKANKMKGDATDEELKTFAAWINVKLAVKEALGDSP